MAYRPAPIPDNIPGPLKAYLATELRRIADEFREHVFSGDLGVEGDLDVGGTATVESTGPTLMLTETDADTNEKNWQIRAAAGVLRFEAWNDALGSSETFWDVHRTGTNIDGFTLAADFISLDGFISFPDGSAQFTGNGSTQLLFVNTAAAANNGVWEFNVSGETFLLTARNDAGSVSTAFLTVDRTGTTVDEVDLAATLISVTGVPGFDGGASATASAGAGTLPANPVGFINVKVGGTDRRVPYYAT